MPDEPENPEELEREAAPPGETGRQGTGKIPAASYALFGIGLELVSSVCLFGAVGWYLDRRWNTFPWLIIAGIAVGFAVGLTMLIRAALRAFKD